MIRSIHALWKCAYTRLNESWHAHQWVMAHSWMSHVAHIYCTHIRVWCIQYMHFGNLHDKKIRMYWNVYIYSCKNTHFRFWCAQYDRFHWKCHTYKIHRIEIPNSSVQIQIEPRFQFEFVPRDTEESEFVDLVDFADVAISVETVIHANWKTAWKCIGWLRLLGSLKL